MAIRVELNSSIIVAGFPVEGVIHLDVAQALQLKASQLRVKCRGKLDTKIEDRRAGTSPGTAAAPPPTRRIHRDSQDLVRWDAVLWTTKASSPLSSTPPTSTNAAPLTLPFSFMTPANLPPDLNLHFPDSSATISYYIEARLERPGMLTFDRKERVSFRCVQPDLLGAQLRPALPEWSGNWALLRAEDTVRKVPIFGQKCFTVVEMDMPAVPVLPLWTPIPIRIRILSLSKKMKRDEWPEDSNKPLFPTPPTQTRELGMKLEVNASIKAGSRLRPENIRTYASALAGLGNKSSSAPLVVLPKVWVPEAPSTSPASEKQGLDRHAEGRWRQEAQCFTKLILDCPPAFAMDKIAIRYELQLEVPFEGLGNTLRCSIDITPVSGRTGPGDFQHPSFHQPPSSYSPPPPPTPPNEETHLPPYPDSPRFKRP